VRLSPAIDLLEPASTTPLLDLHTVGIAAFLKVT
jgi:hypothetical protein